jgi:hypothetical protein
MFQSHFDFGPLSQEGNHAALVIDVQPFGRANAGPGVKHHRIIHARSMHIAPQESACAAILCYQLTIIKEPCRGGRWGRAGACFIETTPVGGGRQ